VGGLLNAPLGNLTELVIALAALRAGRFVGVLVLMVYLIFVLTLYLLPPRG
jgi:Ca2+:H+ antiporter